MPPPQIRGGFRRGGGNKAEGSEPIDLSKHHERVNCSLPSADVDIADFQNTIARTYGTRDAARGTPATVAWLCEELGELAQAVRKGTVADQRHELGDVFAWLASLAHQLDLSLDDAATRYTDGCPRCGALPCACP